MLVVIALFSLILLIFFLKGIVVVRKNEVVIQDIALSDYYQ